MKKLLFFLLLVFGAYFAYDKYEIEIKNWLESTANPEADKNEWDEKYPDRPYEEYSDAVEAFEEDQLFAVMSKTIINKERYLHETEKNAVGKPVPKFLPAVHVLRCLGRETRKNYLFIVDLETFDGTRRHEKLTKDRMADFEFFLSEKRLKETVAKRRALIKTSS